MTVRSKTLVITGVTLLILVAVVLTAALALRMRDYVQLEEQGVSEDVQRVVRAVRREVEGLDRSAADYAGWDDTYAYAADRNQAYIETNFIADTLIKNDLSLVAILNSAGEVLFTKAMDLAEGKETEPPAGLGEHLKPGTGLLAGADPDSSTTGFLALADSTWLVASRPILTSAYTGPARGTVVFARRVDERLIAKIGELTGVEACVCGQGTDAEKAECAAARQGLASGGNLLIRPVDDRVVRGFTLIQDVYGQPSLLLRIDAPRKFRSQFFAGLWLFSLCAAVALLILGGISIFIMDRHVLGRLGTLISFVKGVRTDENLSSRLALPGGDELTDLAESTNEMLAALEKSAAQRLHAEEALRASEAKYRDLVQNANSIIMRWDVDGRITFFNEYAQEFFGYSESEVLGKNVVGMIVPDTESTGRDLAAHVADVCRRTHLYRVNENENIRKDGSRVWISWTNKSVLDAAGRVVGILSVGTDITDRRRAETALRESERKYRRLVELAQEGVWQIDENALTTFVNPRMAEMLGYSVDEMLGTSLFTFVDEDTKATLQNSLKTKGRLDRAEREVGLTRKNGAKIVTAVAAAPVLDTDGRFRGSVAVVADITDRKRAGDELRDRQAKLESILRAAPTGIGVVVDRVFTEVNENFCRMLGYSKDELLGRSSRMIYPSDEDFEFVGREKYGQINRVGVGTVETRFLCKDGRILDVLSSSSPIVPGDSRAGVTFAALDITERKKAESALARERNLLRTLIDILPDCVYVMDRDGRKIMANPADLRSIGAKSMDDILGKTDFEIYPREVAQEFYDNDQQVITTGRPLLNKEEVMPSPDGHPRTLLTTKVPLRDDQGRIVGLVGIGRDITDRKAALEALQDSEKRYRSLFESMTNAYAVDELLYDESGAAVDYRIIDVNRAWERIIGRSRDEAVGKTYGELFGPIDPGWLSTFDKVVSTGESASFERQSAAFGKWFEAFAYRIEGTRFAVTFADVTERHKAEEEIRTLHGQIDFILGATKTGIDIIDSQMNVRFVDPEWARVYGDYAGKKCYAYFMDRSEPCPGCGIPKALETKQVTVTEEILVREGNRPVQVTTLPYRDTTGEWLVAEVNVDISDRKGLEAQLLQAQKMEAIGQLAGGIAHDFNNLLTGILGYANMLKLESKPGSQVFEAAGTIEKAAERAAELTKQLLGFARRGKYLRMPVDLHGIVQEVIRLLSRTIEKNISIVQRLSTRAPWVSGDPDQIEQMLLNLAVNARDAMPDGGELSIETEIVDVDESYCRTVPEASPGKYIRLTVTDTGCGIPEDLRGRIFEPFFTTKELGKGTGMGLAMVYGVVKNHGGFIRLYSEPGEGARFDVYLPASDEIPPPPQPRPAPAKGTGRILFVDDEQVVRNVASDMLRSLGYEVTPAQSGDEAVDVLMRDKMSFDLAIIDLVMPGLDARECFRKLRVICPSLKAILSSGYGLNGRAQETVDEGMLGFIQKPYTLADLAAAVGNAINSR